MKRLVILLLALLVLTSAVEIKQVLKVSIEEDVEIGKWRTEFDVTKDLLSDTIYFNSFRIGYDMDSWNIRGHGWRYSYNMIDIENPSIDDINDLYETLSRVLAAYDSVSSYSRENFLK